MPPVDYDTMVKIYGPTLGGLLFGVVIMVYLARKWVVDWRKDGSRLKAQDANDNAQDATISAVNLLQEQMTRQANEIEGLLAALKQVRRQNLLLETICAKQGIDVIALYKQHGLE